MSLRTLGAIVGTIGAGMSGYARGKRDYEADQAFKEDRDFQRGQRARMVKKQGEEDALGDALKGAAGSTDAQIRAYEAAGRPVEAMDLRTKSRADKLGQMQLDEAQRTHLNRTYDDELDKKATSFDALAQFISDSNGDGQGGAMKVRAVPTADGKKITLNRIGPDGTLTPTEYTFDNTQGGLASAKALLSRSVTPQMKLAHLYQQAQAAEQARHNQATESTAARNAATAEAAQRATAAYHARMAGVAEGKVGATPGPQEAPPIWDDKADAFLRERYTVKDPMTGTVGVDGNGMQFAKVLALGQARINGGDTTRALGYAFERDNLLRAAATDAQGNYDPAKHAQLRQDALRAMMTPKQPAGGANGQWDVPGRTNTAPAPASPAPAAPAAPAPRASMAPHGDRVLADIEQQQMAQLAPLVQAFVAAKQQLAAAGKSGDAQAAALYSQRAQQANAALREKAAQLLGNNADRFLATVP